jgi:hypothetical protein
MSSHLEYIWQIAGGLSCSTEGCGEEVAYRRGDVLLCRTHAAAFGPPMTTMTPSDEYLAVAREVQDWIAAQQGKEGVQDG